MQLSWRERNHEERIKKTKEALVKNSECASAMILLAEEDCSYIVDVGLFCCGVFINLNFIFKCFWFCEG